MKRDDAVKLLKAVMAIHEEGDMQHIDLANPNHNVDGYRLQIKATKHHGIDELKSLLAKYGVTVREENDFLIIY